MKRVVIVLLSLLLSVVLGACSSLAGGDRVAVVNGHTISRTDLETRQKIYELFFEQPMDSPATQQQLLDQMINEYLLLDQAEKLKVVVSDAQVENELGKFFGALDRQYQSRDAVMAKVASLGLSNDMIVNYLQDSITSKSVVEKQKESVTVTPDELKSFYVENLETLYQPTEEVVRAAHVLLPLDQEAKAKEVAAKAKAGGNFAELAKLYSVDTGNSRTGGDLGYFTRTTMVAAFADAAFSLQPGQISEPVKSPHGWHVIKLIDKRKAGLIPFDKAKEDAATRLLTKKQDEAFEQWLRNLQQSSKVEKVTAAPGAAIGKNE